MDVKVVIELTADEQERISRPIHGKGGFQSLLSRLQTQINGEQHLILTLSDVRSIVRGSSEYGTGGFQERLGAVLSALSRLADVLKLPRS